jgi:hypothetical protein
MTTQMILWLKTPMAFNGGECCVCAADVESINENGDAVVVRPERNLVLSVSHVAPSNQDGNVDDLIGLVNEAGFIDFRQGL